MEIRVLVVHTSGLGIYGVWTYWRSELQSPRPVTVGAACHSSAPAREPGTAWLASLLFP
ncbi:hypothetical protein N656DRAFT_778076 [Canariomyces notabilis]|uniref:Uncharacterized protein n=1 Tax=Canariomyces notabilis TaxID=2074819 RepID=A0AAN6TGH8_9PEZI|nr:hypothetical protein N656DRAFT_778076 [Canariomyces arenarius]